MPSMTYRPSNLSPSSSSELKTGLKMSCCEDENEICSRILYLRVRVQLSAATLPSSESSKFLKCFPLYCGKNAVFMSRSTAATPLISISLLLASSTLIWRSSRFACSSSRTRREPRAILNVGAGSSSKPQP